MTYDEIKQRLTQVENTLQTISNTGKPVLDNSYTAKSLEKLTTLKESLQKQLAEKDETMFISTKGGDTKAVQMDRKTAMDLKKDPNITGIDTAKGQSLKEVDRLTKNSGVEFDKKEVAIVAKSTGKALAIALKKAGDEIARMKAIRLDVNSFDVEVTYKGEKRGYDEFSFYITDNELHLVDFSFDKTLVQVGVKPSGEPIVNVDVLANELLKHFKSLNLDVNEVNRSNYTTPKHFDICPGAEALRDELIKGGKSPEELGEWTFKHDELFKLEKAVIKANKADERHIKVAKQFKSEIINLSRDLGIAANKIGYLSGHVKKIEDIASKTDGKGDNVTLMSRDISEGEGDDHHYIKVPRREYKKAMSILDGASDGNFVKMDFVDDDGAGNVIIYFKFSDGYIASGQADAYMYDAVMDLQAQSVSISDHSAELDEDYDPDQEQLDDEDEIFMPVDDEGRPLGGGRRDVKRPSKFKKAGERAGFDMRGIDEDLDVGHQDDEPSMLKASAFETAEYAAKLVKKLAQYDQVDGEVDFPNWWQKKLILARDYMSAAFHYLDSEEKQPAIDQLALEHAMNEGTELYDRNGINIKRFSGGKKGLMVQITYGGDYLQVPADVFPILAIAMQSVKNDLKDMSRQVPRRKNIDEIKAAKIQKAHGQVVAKMKELAKQYKAGDKSVVPQLKDLTAKKKALEADLERAVAGTHQGQELTELSTEQRNELIELQNILDDVAQKGEEAREIIRQSFPRMLSKADAYGAFEFGSSANRYDTTLESIIEEIEEYYDEEEDDMDEGKYKSDAQRKAIHAKKAELKEMDGGSLFDYFQKKGYDITERRPDGYPPKEGVVGYQVSRGNDRYPQSVIFQYSTNNNEFTISRMSGYRIDQKQAMKAGMREAGRSGAAGMDSYMTDGNYTPVGISAEGLKDIVDHVMSGLDRESKAQSDFYKDRGHTSGTIDEKSVSENMDIKKASTDKLEKILKQSEDEKVSPAFASQLKLIRKELQNRKKNLQEGATCCGRCGRVHVKGSGCKRPYLKGKSHCRNK